MTASPTTRPSTSATDPGPTARTTPATGRSPVSASQRPGRPGPRQPAGRGELRLVVGKHNRHHSNPTTRSWTRHQHRCACVHRRPGPRQAGPRPDDRPLPGIPVLPAAAVEGRPPAHGQRKSHAPGQGAGPTRSRRCCSCCMSPAMSRPWCWCCRRCRLWCSCWSSRACSASTWAARSPPATRACRRSLTARSRRCTERLVDSGIGLGMAWPYDAAVASRRPPPHPGGCRWHASQAPGPAGRSA